MSKGIAKVVVTGSLAFDFIMNFPGKFSDNILPDKIHKINLSFLVNRLSKGRGGCGGNIAYNLSLLGVKPILVGILGRDGREYVRWLGRRGVDVRRVVISKKMTAMALVMTDRDDNQLAAFYPGAIGQRQLSLKEIGEGVDLVIIAPNPTKLMAKYVAECQAFGFDYLYDPGMQLPRLTKEELVGGVKGAKIVVGNDYEMEVITSRYEIRNTRYGDQIWITTLGKEGSVIEYQGKKIKIPAAKPLGESDPTGAGDAYRAGFVWAWLQGLSLEKAGRVGGLLAAYTVEKYGTTTHRFTMKEFRRRYQENFDEPL